MGPTDQYCDWDGDLVADLPSNESDWVDPDTIIFSYTPVEDPAVEDRMAALMSDLLDKNDAPPESFARFALKPPKNTP